MKSIYFYDLPVGRMRIAEEDGAISHVVFSNKKMPDDYEVTETPLIKKAAEQLTEYLSGKRVHFNLPLKLKGTEFQVSVWKALQTIPYGETRSYKDIAVMTGNPKACRAVGMANNRNPVAIIVPCHRVVGHSGGLTGYAGGLPVKEFLLKLEKHND